MNSWKVWLDDLKRDVKRSNEENNQDDGAKVMDILLAMGDRIPTDKKGIESLHQYIREHKHDYGIEAGMELDTLFEWLKWICDEDMSPSIITNMPMVRISEDDAFFEENHKNKIVAMAGIRNQIIYNIANQMTIASDEKFNKYTMDFEIRKFTSIYTYLDWKYEYLSRKELIYKLTMGLSEDDLEHVFLKADGTVVIIWD